MPERKYPWDDIKSEFLSGVNPKQIAAKYGASPAVISATASRKKWTQERVKNGVERTASVVKSVKDSLQEQADTLGKLVVKTVFKNLEALSERKPPKDVYESNALASAVQKFNDIGRKAFGLDDSTIRIQVGIIGQAPEIVAPALPAIEIEATSSTVEPAIRDKSDSVNTEPANDSSTEAQQPLEPTDTSN